MSDSSGLRAHDVLAPCDVFIDTESAWAQLPCEVPAHLDSFIRADREAFSALADARAGWRWYRGVDGAGVVHIFQFQRGGPIELWHRSLTLRGLRSVSGPFRSQHHAHAGVRLAASHPVPGVQRAEVSAPDSGDAAHARYTGASRF